MQAVGYMPMPANFQYRAVYEMGKPNPPKKHPAMDTGRRAKIFAPFAALRGFDAEILSKDVIYEEKRLLEESDRVELDRRLNILHNLTFNGRMARANMPVAAITYFVPCADRNNEAFGLRGQYTTIEDVVWNVDMVTATVLIGKTRIKMDDIAEIHAEKIFDTGWEYEAI